MRLRLVAVLLALLVASTAYAIPAPEIVLEDTLVLGVRIASVELDTVHFDEPTLLVGSYPNEDSVSFVFRVAVSPLRLVATVPVGGFRVDLIRAGDLDGDTVPDFLVGHGNTLMGYTSSGSADPPQRRYPAGLTGVEIDDITGGIWVGFDTAVYYSDEWSNQHIRSDGGVYHYASWSAPGRPTSNACMGMQWIDIDSNGVANLATLNRWYHGQGCGIEFSYASGSSSIYVFDSLTNTIHSRTLVDFGADLGNTLRSGITYAPAPIADLDGDGDLEIVLSYSDLIDVSCEWNPWVGFHLRVEGLLDMDTLWEHPGSYMEPHQLPPPVHLWQLDDDSLPDIVRYHPYHYHFTGVQGKSGEILFDLTPVSGIELGTVFDFDHDGREQCVIRRSDTIYVFRLDAPASVGDRPVTPEQFELYANFPNPFNAATEIEYSLDAPGKVRLDIFNVLGRHVKTLVDDTQPAGPHRLTWNAANAPSGVYFYRLTVGDHVQTRKMVVLK